MKKSGTSLVAAAACMLLAAIFILSIDSASLGKDKPVPRPRFYRPDIKETSPDIPGYVPRASIAAAADSHCIVSFDFEQMNWQGWTRVDNTAQFDTFARVDDFAGLGGGSHGRLVPLEGTKSLWFGTRPGSSPYLCSWPPSDAGYGNDWDQLLMAWAPDTLVELSYHLVCDTEPGKDIMTVSWLNGDEEILATYSGVVDTIATHAIEKPYSTEWGAYYIFRFTSDGAVSDQDGAIDTDGAVIVDSITIIYDGSVLDYEDFESFDPGQVPHGRWDAAPGDPYGRYSDVANNFVDHDPCAKNFATIIMFFSGSSWPSIYYPGFYDTPFCDEDFRFRRPCQDEMVISPWIDLDRGSLVCDETQDYILPPGELGDLGGVMLSFTAYLDNPITNLVFHTWKVRNLEDGCPGQWLENPVIRYYGDDGRYYRFEHDISDFITGDSIQVALGIVDMCSVWYGIYGDCAEHTPAPWYDNVKVTRYKIRGPQWRCEGADRFQDNFPSTDDIESWVRADMAADVSPLSYPGIIPGDSAVVSCWAPNAGGLDTLGTGEARVYFHCNVHFLGLDGKPDLFGPSLEGSCGSYTSDDGDWTILLCEPARASNGAIAPDRYCIDLNDSIFTRGYMIEYYFKAFDLDGESATLPVDTESHLFEFTCLPSARVVPSLLYVDDFDGRGTPEGLVQTYFDPTVKAIIAAPGDTPDRYDVNQPSSMVGNSLGSRARLAHFTTFYQQIHWDSGDLSEGTIISGESSEDKSDDIGFLSEYLDAITWSFGSGLMVMGDNVASDLSQYIDGQAFLADWGGLSLVDPSYYDMTGGWYNSGVVSPLVTGVAGGPFEGLEFYIYGGCPLLADFDVFDIAGNGIPAITYPEFDGNQYYAGVLLERENSLGMDVRTQWYGFSLMRIRNSEDGVLARNLFLNNAWRNWLHGPGGSMDLTGDEVPAVTALAGVYPNPFNPATRLQFSLKHKGHISLRVYDVSGRLVRVLVDEIREAGSYEIAWDGTNNSGRRTASGIYFCRMEAKDYERTLKMVLLR